MAKQKMGKEDAVLEKWLEEFKRETTRKTYFFALNNFKKRLGIADLGAYVKNKPDVVADVRTFLAKLDGKPSKTVHTYMGALKMFLQDQGLKISGDEWRKIRRRGFMPKRVKAETRDRKPTREELRKILNYADIKCRALVLFLLSSGARIGETLQLKTEDFKLEADPPEVNIRGEYTKGGAGARVTYFSYEACDAILDWLKIKDKTSRRSGVGTYKSERVFPWKYGNAMFMWNISLEKAGLDLRDNTTKRRVLHLHSLRKFFRSNIGLDLDVTHALMGHAEYLDDAYLRLEQEGEIAKAYGEAMSNVSIYNVEDQQLRTQTGKLEKENLELKERIFKMESERNSLEGRMLEMEKQLGEIRKHLQGLELLTSKKET